MLGGIAVASLAIGLSVIDSMSKRRSKKKMNKPPVSVVDEIPKQETKPLITDLVIKDTSSFTSAELARDSQFVFMDFLSAYRDVDRASLEEDFQSPYIVAPRADNNVNPSLQTTSLHANVAPNI